MELDWVFNESLATPGMQMSVPTSLSTEKARDTSHIVFRYPGTTLKDMPSICSPENPPKTLVAIQLAADTFLNGGLEGFIAWIKDRCSITQTE